jgi:NAD kinase
MNYERLVVVTRKTRLEELVERFNTRGQARFYLEHAGGNFAEYEQEHDAYRRSLEQVRQAVSLGLPCQFLDRSLVPTYTFDRTEVVVVLGQDGLVANVAKYAGDQPIIGVNPDPARFDGFLLPFGPIAARRVVVDALSGRAHTRPVTLAQATLADGQRLLAFNDLFIGARTHVSARYRIRAGTLSEPQSSSGVIVATGAGSTGWMSSVFNMAAGVATFTGGAGGAGVRLEWEDPRLIYAVREPFVSRHSAAGIVAGLIGPNEELELESLMPSGGVIFSDGVEADFLAFNAGAVGRISAAAQRAHLVVLSD